MSTHQSHHAQDHGNRPERAMAELLELDAEVLRSYLAELTAWLAGLADRVPTRILDVGSGPGTGSFALARQFPEAVVTAVDVSAEMLHRLAERASAQGIADRVHTLRADLDEEWPVGGCYDLVWAAASLHHLKDPDQALARMLATLRPGGLLAVTEMDFFPCFLPEDPGIGRPGLEARLHAATNSRPPSDWTEHLARAGFALEARRPFEIAVPASSEPAVTRYARLCLSRMRAHAEGGLPVADLAALDALLADDGPSSVLHRGDLTARTTRTTWVARRP